MAIGCDLDSEEIAARVKKPLEGLKPVSYYGCVLVRPSELTGWDDPEHPMIMDRLLRAAGAEPVAWSYVVDCCGASLTLGRLDVVKLHVNKLVQAAEEAGADCIVTACGMCQINLDIRQKGHHAPIFYFTELLGLAFDLPGADGWLKRHATDPRPLLRSLGGQRLETGQMHCCCVWATLLPGLCDNGSTQCGFSVFPKARSSKGGNWSNDTKPKRLSETVGRDSRRAFPVG